MNSFASITKEINCKHDYFDILSNEFTSPKIILLSISIIALTILIECVVHHEVTFRTKKKDSASTEATDTAITAPPSTIEPELPTTTDQDINTPKDTTEPSSWCNPHPSPRVKSNRLVLSTFLLLLLITAFAFRIDDTRPPHVRHQCEEVLAKALHANWWLATLFNIVPFVIGVCAWLRALVDCWLTREGKDLGYFTDDSDYHWPVLGPVFCAFIVVLGPLMAIGTGARWGIEKLMGSPETGKKAGEDIEMGGQEERVRLVDGVDGAGVDDGDESDGPPAYDASWRAEGVERMDREAEALVEAPVKASKMEV